MKEPPDKRSLSEIMDSDAENTGGGGGVEEVGGEVGGKGARWATDDRVRKRCLLSTSFTVKLNITARKNHNRCVAS